MEKLHRLACFGNVILILLLVPVAGNVSLYACEIPKEQKIQYARLLLNEDPWLQEELGVLENPWEYSKLSDGEVARELEAATRSMRAAEKEHYHATLRLQMHEKQLLQSRKVTRAQLQNCIDPTGNLERLRAQVHRKYDVLGKSLGRKIELQREYDLRQNPDKFLETAKGLKHLQRECKGMVAHWKERWKKLGKIERTAGMRPRLAAGIRTKKVFETGRKGEPSRQTFGITPSLVSQPACSEHVVVTYEDIYPFSGITVNDIEAFEAQELRRLPSEVRRLPVHIQKLFIYGGYENLPRNIKRMVRHAAKTSSPGEVEQVYRTVQHLKPPPQLVNQFRAERYSAIAYGVAQIAQWATDKSHEIWRDQKIEKALKEIAGSIPAGVRGKVLIIEEVRKHQTDIFVWFETVSVKAFPGKVSLEKQTERLDDLSKAHANDYWHFRRLFTATVLGTGKKKSEMPSVREAFESGVEIGRLVRGAKGSKDLIRKVYGKYNKYEPTREAFKWGYTEAAAGPVDIPESLSQLDTSEVDLICPDDQKQELRISNLGREELEQEIGRYYQKWYKKHCGEGGRYNCAHAPREAASRLGNALGSAKTTEDLQSILQRMGCYDEGLMTIEYHFIRALRETKGWCNKCDSKFTLKSQKETLDTGYGSSR
jgi:hypothetical protein